MYTTALQVGKWGYKYIYYSFTSGQKCVQVLPERDLQVDTNSNKYPDYK